MTTKKKPSPHVKPREKPKAAPPTRLQNLAARPSYEDLGEEQLVDASGVFRVTSSIAQAQTGHDEEPTRRFPNDSLVMAAQRDGFRDEGPTIDESLEVEDEATAALKRERVATLAARAQARTKPRR
ncbi:MAG: hypothetical protein IPQ07_26295 [Myxococcales bacterium]|nr:hypothetical protein [Myxococcales bacterium]